MTSLTIQVATVKKHEAFSAAVGCLLLASGLMVCSGIASAQEDKGASVASNGIPHISAPNWGELPRDQQVALSPLQKAWPELTDGQRRKWIAVVRNFSKLSVPDQEKIQDRMEDWAALKPAQRELARDNFASSKLAPTASKAGSWEEYQALPQEERDRLAAQAKATKPRAAKSPKATPTNPPPPTPNVKSNYPLQPGHGELRTLLSPATLLPLQRQTLK